MSPLQQVCKRKFKTQEREQTPKRGRPNRPERAGWPKRKAFQSKTHLVGVSQRLGHVVESGGFLQIAAAVLRIRVTAGAIDGYWPLFPGKLAYRLNSPTFQSAFQCSFLSAYDLKDGCCGHAHFDNGAMGAISRCRTATCLSSSCTWHIHDIRREREREMLDVHPVLQGTPSWTCYKERNKEGSRACPSRQRSPRPYRTG